VGVQLQESELALVGNARIAILDELTTGLDPQARRDTWQLIEDVRARGVTVLLVTHSMEEAERLCDRIALIDAGRIVALDTPAGIVSRARLEQRVQFRPSAPLNVELLTDLAEVHDVTWSGPTLTVVGSGDVLGAVTSVLARHQIVAHELRAQQADLDDAFVALTGRGRPARSQETTDDDAS
jgi:ABC-2 type transport system ATP-binding protein